MTKMTTELKVGFFVITGVLILTYMTFAVGKFTWGKEKGYRVYALLSSAAGLDAKALVKIAGVEVGKIEGIELEGTQARVSMRMIPGVPLKAGTLAMVRSTGLLGDKYIELLPGKGVATLQPNAVIGQAEAPADIDKLITEFTAVGSDLREVSASLRILLGSEKNRDTVVEILENLREMSERLSRIVRSNERLIDETLVNLKGLSSDLHEVVSTNKTPLNETLRNLEGFSKSLREEGPLLIARLNSIAEKIQNGEGTLGKLVTDKSLYEKLDATLAGVNKFVSSVDRFTTNVGFRGEYQVQDSSTKGYFSLRLQPRADKYYLFELADDPKGRVRVTDTKTTTTPGGTVAVREVRRSDQLKFSAQFARRYDDVVVRGGLMESSFGVGTDFLRRDDRFKLTLEAWNFDGEAGSPNPHVKVASTYTFFKNLFIHGGFDDLANSKTANAFVGGGLYFDDEDLKYLIQRLPISVQ